MAYDKEVVAQVLKNIRLIEETHRVVIAVTEIVEQAINKITEELVSSGLDQYCSEASKFDYAKTGDSGLPLTTGKTLKIIQNPELGTISKLMEMMTLPTASRSIWGRPISPNRP